MIKYYSTLNETFYDTETQAQNAEDLYVKKYFEELDLRAAEKRRKLRSMNSGLSSRKKYNFPRIVIM